MNTRISLIFSKSILSLVIILTLVVWPSNLEQVKASNGDEATKTRLSGQRAFFYRDEGNQFVGLTITRDEIANTTFLSFGYRFPDPNDSNQTIYINGEEAEIPNSAFTINSDSARLTVTTPDSYLITRCVANNETGEFTCTPTGPSRFDLTWIKDNTSSFQEKIERLQTSGSVTMRSRGRYDEVSATASGTWDGYSGTNMTGYLADYENVTRIRDEMEIVEASPYFFSPMTLQVRLEAVRKLRDRVQIRDAFSILHTDEGLNGFVTAWHDEITDTTQLHFGYAFPDPNDPSRVLFYEGLGEIPKSAFTRTSDSARLRLTTPESYWIAYCIITGIIGEPGSFICYRSPTSVTLDLTWTADGYGSLDETLKSVLTEVSVTTRHQRQFSQVTAPLSGTWYELNQHAGTNMVGDLSEVKSVTTSRANP